MIKRQLAERDSNRECKIDVCMRVFPSHGSRYLRLIVMILLHSVTVSLVKVRCVIMAVATEMLDCSISVNSVLCRNTVHGMDWDRVYHNTYPFASRHCLSKEA